jgi:hypothetical protein
MRYLEPPGQWKHWKAEINPHKHECALFKIGRLPTDDIAAQRA